MQSGFFQDSIDLADKIRLLKLPAGNVDARGKGGRYWKSLFPYLGLAAHLAENPLAEGLNQSAFLCQRNEVRRGNQPAAGVLAADESLKPYDPPGLKRQDGLVLNSK